MPSLEKVMRTVLLDMKEINTIDFRETGASVNSAPNSQLLYWMIRVLGWFKYLDSMKHNSAALDAFAEVMRGIGQLDAEL